MVAPASEPSSLGFGVHDHRRPIAALGSRNVHTTEKLRHASFEIRLAGKPAELSRIWPGFAETDRLGIVVREPCGAIGASVLTLATVTAFYDLQRRRADDFFVYPDYFCIHVGARHGDHNMLDIWPRHKEPVVPAVAEEVLRAVNDRGVTRLLVPDGAPRELAYEPQTVASAGNRIATTLAYSATGRTREADVEIDGNETTERYADAVLDESSMVPSSVRERIRSARSRELIESGRPLETYRRITLEEGLALIAGGCSR
jgi:hypothetical protein